MLTVDAPGPGLEAYAFTLANYGTVLARWFTRGAQIIALFGAGVASFLAPCIVRSSPPISASSSVRSATRTIHGASRTGDVDLHRRFTTVFAFLILPDSSARRSRPSRTSSTSSVASYHVMGLALLGISRTIFGRTTAHSTAARDRRGRPELRRRCRVRRLEPVRRTVARGGPHDRGAIGRWWVAARSCLRVHSGNGRAVSHHRARSRVVAPARRTSPPDRPGYRTGPRRLARRSGHVVRPTRTFISRRISLASYPPFTACNRGRERSRLQRPVRGDTASSSSGSRHHTSRQAIRRPTRANRGAVCVPRRRG